MNTQLSRQILPQGPPERVNSVPRDRRLSDDVGPVLLITALTLLLLAAADRCLARLLLVHDELGVALLFVPLETGEVRVLELVVGLCRRKASAQLLSRVTAGT